MRLAASLRKLVGLECGHDAVAPSISLPKIIIVGSPNVGKSLLFNRLTGRYVTVSNYPGTTVEITRGRSRILNGRFEVLDTPGMYSLLPITAEERVASSILALEKAHAVLHVMDAKNIERMLGLTLRLIEAGLPVILVLNMYDEARQINIRIDVRRLEALLGVPVVATVATTGEGLGELALRIRDLSPLTARRINYGPVLEEAVARIVPELDEVPNVSRRARALFLLQGDPDERDRLAAAKGGENARRVLGVVSETAARLEHSVHCRATLAVQSEVDRIVAQAVAFPSKSRREFRDRLSDFCMNPITGVPLLVLVLYFGLYKFVGEFGAGTIVNLLEGKLFEGLINPWVTRVAEAVIPWGVLRGLFVGEYGVLTLGVRYAVAIILPIVATFYLAFSLLEDTGYLPRLAMLIDRAFKLIGLSGRAVIPMVLGFGCDTMATLVTRTLETRRERIIATILLALAIPCSAQLGVIVALLSVHKGALLAWAGFVGFIFVLVGTLLSRFLPGQSASFYMEVAPLRLPKLENVVVKTLSRVVWYFKEIFPLFIVASIIIWLGDVTGVLHLCVNVLKPVVTWIGLPEAAAKAFLFGFLRRDYGAAGLYDIRDSLTGVQLAVAAITLTLFLPCIAQFLIMKKEHGWRASLLISAAILILAFGSGFVAHHLFEGLGVQL